MRRRIQFGALVALLALAAASTAWAMNAHYTSGTNGLSASDVNLNTPFTNNHSGGDSVAFKAWVVLIRNRGPNPISYDLGDGVATTADTTLQSGDSIIVDYSDTHTGGDGYTGIGIICTAGLTAVVDVDAWR
jgi:hypothetical protein